MTEMIYHTKMVSSVCNKSYIIADLPYLSYENNTDVLKNSKVLLEAGANMVKLEGAKDLNIFTHLIQNNIPVCGHLGLQPQSILELGGYKVQGKEKKDADKILENAIKLQEVGVKLLVLECIPKTLATKITQSLNIPTIGIGAGVDCDGQVLVSYDIFGLGLPLKFSKNFLADTNSIKQATLNFISEVKNKTFPTNQHSF
jgi:3-methyl-2-oxobutanoate hydroxymethyltransferase